MPWTSLRLRVGAAFVAVCSSHVNGFHLDRSTSGVGQSDEGAVRAGARIEMIPQEHCVSRREVFAHLHCAIDFGVVSAFLCTVDSPCFAEAGLESDVGQPTSSKNPASIASNSTSGSGSTSAIECDEECKEQRRRRIEERRAMMRQSRSTSSRQEVFELSKQRARLYGSDYKGANCIDGVPCI